MIVHAFRVSPTITPLKSLDFRSEAKNCCPLDDPEAGAASTGVRAEVASAGPDSGVLAVAAASAETTKDEFTASAVDGAGARAGIEAVSPGATATIATTAFAAEWPVSNRVSRAPKSGSLASITACLSVLVRLPEALPQGDTADLLLLLLLLRPLVLLLVC